MKVCTPTAPPQQRKKQNWQEKKKFINVSWALSNNTSLNDARGIVLLLFCFSYLINQFNFNEHVILAFFRMHFAMSRTLVIFRDIAHWLFYLMVLWLGWFWTPDLDTELHHQSQNQWPWGQLLTRCWHFCVEQGLPIHFLIQVDIQKPRERSIITSSMSSYEIKRDCTCGKFP